MWKKEEDQTGRQTPEAGPGPERASRSPAPIETAVIGPSISIKGDVTGDEDLLIQGRVDGSVDLKQHAVTVGSEGRVKADISGRVVTVEGKVEGNLDADEQVVLRSSAEVEGDITSPRVVLEDGARFRGGVDMGEGSDRGGKGAGSSRRAAKPAEPAGGSKKEGEQASMEGEKSDSERSAKTPA